MDIDRKNLISLANSEAGQQLISLLQSNDSDALEQAMQQAQNGDLTQAKDILQKMLADPQAEALVQKLRSGL